MSDGLLEVEWQKKSRIANEQRCSRSDWGDSRKGVTATGGKIKGKSRPKGGDGGVGDGVGGDEERRIEGGERRAEGGGGGGRKEEEEEEKEEEEEGNGTRRGNGTGVLARGGGD